jgi:ABC-type multidrug transport system ATPase subunit
LSFTVEPGRVTGFVGPNGAGKTTTLRMLLDLVEPTAGTATGMRQRLGVAAALLGDPQVRGWPRRC